PPAWPSSAIHEEASAVLAKQPTSNPSALLPRTVWHDPTDDHAWPIMDSLNQDAIRMMTEDVFSEANPRDPFFMTYNELLAYLRRNSNLVAYIEVLGCIF
ncbi:hypothetical protein EV175_005586, partial [Coemansia sp. RSA 1933]